MNKKNIIIDVSAYTYRMEKPCLKKKEKVVKRLKSKKGFTLVEVIVVAVIVAVLAAVAIPLYLNYVTNARLQVAENGAGSLASFCGACINSGAAVTPIADVAAGTKILCNPTNGTTWIVPDNTKATVTATQATVTHLDGGSKTVTFN
ncbi:MAG: prepilin-type N-terminal cleavage/methylation domain-containing protein [bacterium]